MHRHRPLTGGFAFGLCPQIEFLGRPSTRPVLAQIGELTAVPAPLDLVLCYRVRDGDVDGWADFVGQVVDAHGGSLAAVQVTGEANLTSVPAAADGAYPRAVEALVQGVVAAAAAKERSEATAAIGFAVSPEVDPASSVFWAELARRGGERFAAAVDYAGLDMYPDVFGPRFELDRLEGAVDWLLRSFRESNHGLITAKPKSDGSAEAPWPSYQPEI